METTRFEALKAGDLVQHKGGKTYKIKSLSRMDDPAWSWHQGFGQLVVSAVQWQVNEKFPEGRPFQASKLFTADKLK